MIKKHLSDIGAALRVGAKRFPLAILFTEALFISFLFSQSELLTHIKLFILCGFFWSLAGHLAIEAAPDQKNVITGGIVAGFVALAGVIFLPSFVDEANMGTLLAALLSAAVVAPYLLGTSKPPFAFETFSRKFWHALFWAFGASGIVYAGLLGIFVSLGSLFGLHVPSELYNLSVKICFALLAPLFFLGGVPVDTDVSAPDTSKRMRVLVSFIMLPLLVVYTVILYAYMVKIMWLQTMPRGQVVWLVSGYAVWGTAAFILGLPLATASKFIDRFIRSFYWFLTAPLVLLAVALYQRVEAYGLTDRRYMVCFLLIWMVLASMAALRMKRPAIVRTFYTINILMFAAASWGPLSLRQMTVSSQFHRLMAVFQEQAMIVDGRIKAPETPMPTDKASQIQNAVNLILNKGRGDLLAPLLPDLSEQLKPRKYGLLAYKDRDKIMDAMGVNAAWAAKRAASEKESRFFRFNLDTKGFAMPVTGFAYAIELDSGRADKERTLQTKEGVVPMTQSIEDGGVLKITLGKHTYRFDIWEELFKRAEEDKTPLQVDSTDHQARIVLFNLYGEKAQQDKDGKINKVDGQVLVKKVE